MADPTRLRTNHPPDPTRVALGILVDRRHSPYRIFIARRPHTSVYAGYWEFPGGKIEPGESPAQCVQREFLEEVGLRIAVGQPLPVIQFQYAHGLVRLQPFLCTLLNPLDRPTNPQGTEYRWVDLDQLPQFNFPPANTPLIQHLIPLLQDHPEPAPLTTA